MLHVRLDGLQAENQAVADPLVGSAFGHEREHLALALGELGERAVGSGPLDEAGDDGRIEHALTLVDAPERVGQDGDVGDSLLEQVAHSARMLLEQAHGVAGGQVVGEHQHPHPGVGAADRTARRAEADEVEEPLPGQRDLPGARAVEGLHVENGEGFFERVNRGPEHLLGGDGSTVWGLLDAEQNARVAANAERYYRAMYFGGAESWNLRDEHMFETLEALLAFHGVGSKAVVWAHNSHLGDASATAMARRGELNLGQLAREAFGEDDTYLIGMGTDRGTVAAADDWDGPMEIKHVRPAHPDSYERVFHESAVDRFLLPVGGDAAEATLRREERATPQASQDAFLEGLDSLVESLLEDDVAALGFGLPSTIDQRAGRAVASVHIPLADLDFRDRMSERFRLPVAIDNDGNAAAIAEWKLGAGRGASHIVALTLGTGIGGGLILDGELYRGAQGAAGELGHITLDLDGPPCQGTCPGLGHLEALASGTATDRMAAEVAAERPEGDLGRALAAGATVDARLAVDFAAGGPGDARDLLERVGFVLGNGIASLVNVFNPELVVIGGGVARAGNLLLDPARKVVAERALLPARELVRIVPALLGPEAGLVGAGLVGFEAMSAASV